MKDHPVVFEDCEDPDESLSAFFVHDAAHTELDAGGVLAEVDGLRGKEEVFCAYSKALILEKSLARDGVETLECVLGHLFEIFVVASRQIKRSV